MKFARTLIASVAAGLLATSAFAMTEPEHKAAKERCDALSGDAKSKCVDDMKRMYGKS